MRWRIFSSFIWTIAILFLSGLGNFSNELFIILLRASPQSIEHRQQHRSIAKNMCRSSSIKIMKNFGRDSAYDWVVSWNFWHRIAHSVFNAVKRESQPSRFFHLPKTGINYIDWWLCNIPLERSRPICAPSKRNLFHFSYKFSFSMVEKLLAQLWNFIFCSSSLIVFPRRDSNNIVSKISLYHPNDVMYDGIWCWMMLTREIHTTSTSLVFVDFAQIE